MTAAAEPPACQTMSGRRRPGPPGRSSTGPGRPHGRRSSATRASRRATVTNLSNRAGMSIRKPFTATFPALVLDGGAREDQRRQPQRVVVARVEPGGRPRRDRAAARYLRHVAEVPQQPPKHPVRTRHPPGHRDHPRARRPQDLVLRDVDGELVVPDLQRQRQPVVVHQLHAFPQPAPQHGRALLDGDVAGQQPLVEAPARSAATAPGRPRGGQVRRRRRPHRAAPARPSVRGAGSSRAGTAAARPAPSAGWTSHRRSGRYRPSRPRPTSQIPGGTATGRRPRPGGASSRPSPAAAAAPRAGRVRPARWCSRLGLQARIALAQAVQPVVLAEVALAVEQVLQQRHDLVLPHALQAVWPAVDRRASSGRKGRSRRPRRRDGSSAGPGASAASFGRFLDASQRASSPCTGGMRGSSSMNAEAAAHRGVDERDRPVGGVHRADDEQVLREHELLVRRVLQADRRSRYSSRKYSSPKTLARLARLISSMIRTYGRGRVRSRPPRRSRVTARHAA